MQPVVDKKKAAGLLALVFLVGVLTGVCAEEFYERNIENAEAASPPEPAPPRPSLAADHLREELNLDSEQTEQVEMILDQCIMHEADLLRQIQMVKIDGRQRILKVLDSQQRQKFEKLVKRRSED